MPSGRQREMEKGSGGSNSAAGGQGSEMLHSMLAAATPEQQKQILGEHLYPLIQKIKVMNDVDLFSSASLVFDVCYAF